MRKHSNTMTGPSPAMLSIAREAAVAVADTALGVVTSGRWMPTEHCTQGYKLAMNILELEANLGAVCEASFAEASIRAMAENAHCIIGHARFDAAMGNASLSRIADWQLTDGCIEDALVPAYAIIALAA